MYIGPIEPKEKSTLKRTVFRLWPPPRCLLAFLSLSRQQRGLRTRVLHAQWRVVGDLEDSPQRVKTLYSTCKLHTASILKLIGHQTPQLENHCNTTPLQTRGVAYKPSKSCKQYLGMRAGRVVHRRCRFC